MDDEFFESLVIGSIRKANQKDPLEIEMLRRKYKPDVIKLLFIGESPPYSGSFFYRGDSNLYRYTREAFLKAFKDRLKPDEDFLAFFSRLGCYLDDLCLTPINKNYDKKLINKTRSNCVVGLAERIQGYKPISILCVMEGIRIYVEKAITLSGQTHLRLSCLPFPAYNDRNKQNYVNALANHLTKLLL
jgi:hypothetical protein